MTIFVREELLSRDYSRNLKTVYINLLMYVCMHACISFIDILQNDKGTKKQKKQSNTTVNMSYSGTFY